ncbi:MAG: phosphosulfolactate synthase [Pseudoalteromonas sp.]
MQSSSFPFFTFPPRKSKPRTAGITMVLDKHLGINATQDLMQTASAYIDIVKFGWGSAMLYDEELLKKKIRIYRDQGIKVCTGGTFMELAYEKNQVNEMLAQAKKLGFDAIEVSNGIHPLLDKESKLSLIKQVAEQGFYTLSEVGKKFTNEDKALTFDDRVDEVLSDLDAGASKVIMESRESGSVGIFDQNGRVNTKLAHQLFQRIDTDLIIWEAPQKKQQIWLLRQLGNDANIGNVVPEEAMSLESLRLGIRADTFREYLSNTMMVYLELGAGGAMRAQRRDDIVIMVDALRASTTIIECFEQGVSEVTPVVSAEHLVGDITIGERSGEKLPGATYGNSPLEIKNKPIEGKRIVLSSTNGAECICRAKGETNQVLIGSVINARAVAQAALKLAKATGKSITLLAAGRNNLPAIEDQIGVTEILKNLGATTVRGLLEPHYSDNIEHEFLTSESGANLVRLGYIQDVIYCAKQNESSMVPYFDGIKITALAV